MMTSHLARFQLERLAADHPDARVPPAHRVHLEGCDLCRTRLRALLAANTRFLDAQPALRVAREIVAQAERLGPERPPAWWAAPHFARAAIAMLAIGVPVLVWFAHGAAASWSRAQGDASFRVLVKHGQHENRVRDADTLEPGARLAFEYSLRRPAHFMLLGVDDTGTIRRYVPAGGEASTDVRLNATPRGRLVTEIELAPRQGDERLCALFSHQPIAEDAARQAITRSVGAAWASGAGLTKSPRPTPNVQWVSVWFRKRGEGKQNAAELTLR